MAPLFPNSYVVVAGSLQLCKLMVAGAPLAGRIEESFSTEVVEAEDLSLKGAEEVLSMKLVEAEDLSMKLAQAENWSTTDLAAEDPEEIESELKLGRAVLLERGDSMAEARGRPQSGAAGKDAFWSFLINPVGGP